MGKIWVLFRDGDVAEPYGTRHLVAWSEDQAAIQQYAEDMEWRDYHDAKEKEAQGSYGVRLSPDDTDYRAYSVESIDHL